MWSLGLQPEFFKERAQVIDDSESQYERGPKVSPSPEKWLLLQIITLVN